MYHAEIISIGDELLSGETINSNAAFIGKKLHEAGFNITRHTSIGDDKDLIIETVAESLASAPLVIVTGGLGPTLDDLTREAIGELTDSPLEFNEALFEILKKRFGEIDSLENQATVPKGAILLSNLSGTASGLVFLHKQSVLIVLPGVPLEMKLMMESEVLPYLENVFPNKKAFHEEYLYFSNLFESTVDPYLKAIQSRFPELKIGIYPNNSLLKVHFEGNEREVWLAKEEILKIFDENSYESSDGTIEGAIQELFTQKGWTLAVAESCTGGELSARLTKRDRASLYFLGSIVCYANSFKTTFLNISEELLKDQGAVSQTASEALANSLQKTSNSTFSLAITGIAGPSGGSKEKPIGTVFFAIKKDGLPVHSFSIHAKGERAQIIDRSVNSALSELYTFAKRSTL